MDKSSLAEPLSIVNYLLSKDPFSLWMGIEIIEADLGYCKVGCKVKKKMLNAFEVTHGGIIFSLADTALAFSAATYGRVALAIDNSISFMQKSTSGKFITASSKILHLSYKTAVFNITVVNESQELIAQMKGTVYRSDKQIEL